MNSLSTTITIGGRDIVFETGKIARQAGGAVTVRSGETIVLATACRGGIPSDDTDFLPLRVDYQEKFSANGKTLGGFIKRDGKMSEREILMSRLIDRPLRPMFEDGFFHEIQVISCLFSYDEVNSPDPLAICAASAALSISDIPLVKPIGAVRVGSIDGNWVINPTMQEMAKSKLDLMIAGTDDAILMIEGYCDFFTEEQILEAINEGHKAIKTICDTLAKWQLEIGKPKFKSDLRVPSEELIKNMNDYVGPELNIAFRIKEKHVRIEVLKNIETKVKDKFLSEENPADTKVNVLAAYKKIKAMHMREMILNENIRIDGRTTDQIRPITIEQSLLPRTHGSSLFTRGETQSISVCTLGGPDMAQRYEDLDGDKARKFYLQYSFPHYSVGEVGRVGMPSRREIGHGKLAERALSAIIPTGESFAHTIRLEANITESNGSSSMAAVCGGCLSMMDAGVPIARPVSGIAMGLILEGTRHAILSDILGDEDFLGDMDFKITGDAQGITAFQLDIKIEGITQEIMKLALNQAKNGRVHILNNMLEACPKSKEEMSAHAPRIESLKVPQKMIGAVIGPGGKMIRAIMEETGVEINIEDDGTVTISSKAKEGMVKAKERILNIVSEVQEGKVYTGEIVSIVAFGVFVRIFNQEGLCHISEYDHKSIPNLNDVCKVGDKIEVKVLGIGDGGKIKLSRKVLIPSPFGAKKVDASV